MGRINVSFKNNDRDRNLESIVRTAHDQSAFVKECIEFYLENKNNSYTTKDDISENANDIDNIEWEF